MIGPSEGNGAGSPRIAADTVSAVVDAWLPDAPEGSDIVRCVIARRLAAELDRPGLPAYVVPRLAGALIATVRDIEGLPEILAKRTARDELHDLLKELPT